MNHDFAISAEGVSKRYFVGENQTYSTLRDQISKLLTNPSQAFAKKQRPSFWALDDVSFALKQGEVMGVIGKNGAGKSTLLKIISRITEPTRGKITLVGSVSSLLEVGTGFSPELTGRENIYLNGSFLGMRRSEITRKFDDIVEFAEVSKFVDTPVKRYSSGMYVRLAFAVAAHLEPDILIVDEVLAVGDAEFQKRCLNKMSEITKTEGRTILFVSHSMPAVTRLCSKAILLDAGCITSEGPTQKVIDYYLKHQAEVGSVYVYKDTAPNLPAYISKATIVDEQGKPITKISNQTPFSILLDYIIKQPIRQAVIECRVKYRDEVVFVSTDCDKTGKLRKFEPGRYQTTISVPAHLLNTGSYTFEVSVNKPGQIMYSPHIPVNVETVYVPNNKNLVLGDVIPGPISQELDFNTHQLKKK